MSWYRRTPDGWLLALHVQPGARTSAVAGIHGDALKVRIAAPPVEGRANAALIEFVAERLGVARRLVTLEKGGASREKRLRVADSSVDPARLLHT